VRHFGLDLHGRRAGGVAVVERSRGRSATAVALKPALAGPIGALLVGICLAGVPVLYDVVDAQGNAVGIGSTWKALAAVVGVLFIGWGLRGIIRRVRGELLVRVDQQGLWDEMSRYRAGLVPWSGVKRVLVKRGGLSGSLEVQTLHPVVGRNGGERTRTIRIHGLTISDCDVAKLQEVSRRIGFDPRAEAWRTQVREQALVALLTIGVAGIVLFLVALLG
jgi:hypothetical protein